MVFPTPVSSIKQPLPDYFCGLDVFLLTQLRCLIKMWFSLFPRPPCRGPRSGWLMCMLSTPYWSETQRPLYWSCLQSCRDAISTFVNYLHSVPQIWSIVNWASGSCLREKRKLCGTKGQNLHCCQFYFPLILLNTIILYCVCWFKDKGRKPGRNIEWLHAPCSSLVFTLLQQQ